MDEKDTAYIAGFVDGEGCFSIDKSTRKDPRYKTPTYIFSLRVSQTQVEVLEWIQSLLGGGIYERKSRDRAARKRCPNAKTSWHLQLYGKTAENAVRRLAPYLRVKQPHVKVALEFFEKRGNVFGLHNARGQQIALPPEMQAERERLYLEMRKLNRGL